MNKQSSPPPLPPPATRPPVLVYLRHLLRLHGPTSALSCGINEGHVRPYILYTHHHCFPSTFVVSQKILGKTRIVSQGIRASLKRLCGVMWGMCCRRRSLCFKRLGFQGEQADETREGAGTAALRRCNKQMSARTPWAAKYKAFISRLRKVPEFPAKARSGWRERGLAILPFL